MTVRFERLKDRRICLVTAWAPDRRPFRVSCMGGGDGLPHDLATFAAEQALGVADGFFNLTAHGAMFRSSGRRLTRPGRAVIVANRAGLDAAEHAVHAAWDAWRAGGPTPAASALDEVNRRWCALRPGESFELDWHRRPLPIRAPKRRADRLGVRRRRY